MCCNSPTLGHDCALACTWQSLPVVSPSTSTAWMGSEKLVFSYKCVNIDAKALHWPHDGHSVMLGAMHACMCPCSAPTMRHKRACELELQSFPHCHVCMLFACAALYACHRQPLR